MKEIRILIASLFILCLANQNALAQKKSDKKSSAQTESTEPKAFRVHEHVMVTMKDGSQVEAVVHGHVSKKKYWVRQWHSGREGKVHEKYLRHLTESEITALKKTKKK